MATLHLSPENQSCNTLSRRQALAGAAACGGLALPAGAAVAAQLPGDVDPHLAWWRELQEIRHRLDGDEAGDDDLLARDSELERLIAATAPTTPEGAAIVAAMILQGHARWPLAIEPEDRAGGMLARYILDRVPADVKRRAGLEGLS